MLYRKKYIVLLFIAIGFYGCSPDNGEVAGPSDEVAVASARFPVAARKPRLVIPGESRMVTLAALSMATLRGAQ